MAHKEYIDFDRAIAMYDFDMKALMHDYKNGYSKEEREEIFKLCRKISRARIPSTNDSKEFVREEVIGPFFLRSLKVFDNAIISGYFEDKVHTVKLVKDKSCCDDEAELTYTYSRNGGRNFKMSFPKKQRYNYTDQMSYAHEMGHVPEIELVRKSFLEYSETLPIFMEYLIELRKHKDDPQAAFDYFLMERLPIEQSEARDILKQFKLVDLPTKNQSVYYLQQFADYYKYLESLDFVIQLIDRMGEDRKAVGDEIEKIIMGKTLLETRDRLGIDTDGCPRLLREYKRMTR